MSEINTRKALIQAAGDFLTANSSIDTKTGTVTGLPTLADASISWENRKFTPSKKEPWASVFYRPNTPETQTVGACGSDDLNGFIQIDFNVAPDTGEKTHMDWENKARIYFHPGRSFSYGGQSVLVISSGMSQGRHVDNFYRKSLTVGFRSQVKRNEVI